jgi:hypothetical protein
MSTHIHNLSKQNKNHNWISVVQKLQIMIVSHVEATPQRQTPCSLHCEPHDTRRQQQLQPILAAVAAAAAPLF